VPPRRWNIDGLLRGLFILLSTIIIPFAPVFIVFPNLLVKASNQGFMMMVTVHYRYSDDDMDRNENL